MSHKNILTCLSVMNKFIKIVLNSDNHTCLPIIHTNTPRNFLINTVKISTPTYPLYINSTKIPDKYMKICTPTHALYLNPGKICSNYRKNIQVYISYIHKFYENSQNRKKYTSLPISCT